MYTSKSSTRAILLFEKQRRIQYWIPISSFAGLAHVKTNAKYLHTKLPQIHITRALPRVIQSREYQYYSRIYDAQAQLHIHLYLSLPPPSRIVGKENIDSLTASGANQEINWLRLESHNKDRWNGIGSQGRGSRGMLNTLSITRKRWFIVTIKRCMWQPSGWHSIGDENIVFSRLDSRLYYGPGERSARLSRTSIEKGDGKLNGVARLDAN